MKETGGYFELELNKGSNHYHDTPYVLKSGRAALHHILCHTKPRLVYLPFYTCDTLLEPLVAANIEYRFYGLNEFLEPLVVPELKPGQYFLYINYFDLKRETVALLSDKYGDKLIVDGTQAFFMKGNGVSWFFNSCRKFFGVPDGAYLYPPAGVELTIPAPRNETYITDHLLQRFNGHAGEGYDFFVKNETLAGVGNTRISKLSEYLLAGINYKGIAEARRENYLFLHDRFRVRNLFNADLPTGCVPMGYPFLPAIKMDKSMLFADHIFVPTLWKDTELRQVSGFELEKRLSELLWPLPVDHRYNVADMEFMHEKIVTLY